MNWPAYQEVKDSGVQWIGATAKHWLISPVRAAMREIDIRNHQARNQNYLSLMANIGVIPYEEKGDVGNKKPDDLAKCKVVEKNDFVINSMNYQIGSYGVSSYDGVCSPVYIVLRHLAATASLRFALRVFETKDFQRYAQSFGNGILEHRRAISWDTLKNLRVPLPPLDEQQAIADFLDRETAKIDALIRKQEQLIATLREDRTATITHTVTKGVDRKAEMRDSGVEWLGDIPFHWKHSLVKFACTTVSGYPFKSDGFSHDPADIRLLRGANVGVNQIDWTDVVYWPRQEASALAVYALKQGDIVMGLDRPFIGAGIRVSRIASDDVPSLLLQRVLRLRVEAGWEQDYLFYLLTGPGIVHHLTPMFTGVSVPHVSPDQVGSFPVPQPPMAEQRQIVARLVERCTQIDELIAKAQESVDILREYRSALITDAVTGKIDVRGAVA